MNDSINRRDAIKKTAMLMKENIDSLINLESGASFN